MRADPQVTHHRPRTRLATLAATTIMVLLTPAAPFAASTPADATRGDGRSSQLIIGDTTVEVVNGSPSLERLVLWAFDQFTARGLGRPPVSRVTFRSQSSCTGVTGWIAGGDVTVCYVHEEACLDPQCTQWRPWVRRTAVHELAHAWMAEWLTRARIEAFMAETGLPTWASDTWPWQERGVELAAETFAWASLEMPARVNARLGNPTCADLVGYYRILTGVRLGDRHCAGADRPTQPGAGGRPAGWVHTKPARSAPALVATPRRSADAAERSAPTSPGDRRETCPLPTCLG